MRAALARLRHQVWDLPDWAPQRPVLLRPGLVAFVAGLWVLAGGLAVVVPWNGDPAAAVVAGVVVGGMAAYAIPAFGGVQGQWSASGFFNLAFSYTIGPPAIVAMALGQSAGSALRRRPGTFRTIFNVANHLLENTAAWYVFHHFVAGGPVAAELALRGAAGGVAASIVNVSLLAAVVSLAGEPSRFWDWVRSLGKQMPLAAMFGVTAAGATLLYAAERTFGIVTLLLPLAMVQGALVMLARRTHEHATEQEAQARERERLLRSEARASRVAAAALQRAATAAEDERHRIAADLHDGVIQDVYGLFMTAGALGMRLADGDGPAWSRESVRRFVDYSKQVAAGASRDLRALMVELAPPLLDKEGLAAALRLILVRLDREGIAWVLDCTEDRMEPRQQRLVHRVVLEAVRNVIKHARASQVRVTVRPVGEGLVASVRDEGVGFSPDTRAHRRQQGHNGLGLLERTVRDGGGRLSIQSADGHGTTVTLVLPVLLPPAADDGDLADGQDEAEPDDAAVEATLSAFRAATSEDAAAPAAGGRSTAANGVGTVRSPGGYEGGPRRAGAPTMPVAEPGDLSVQRG